VWLNSRTHIYKVLPLTDEYILSLLADSLATKNRPTSNLIILATPDRGSKVFHSYMNATGASHVCVLNIVPVRSMKQENFVTSNCTVCTEQKQSHTLILFSDEVWFYLSRHVDLQNNKYWSADNPVLIH